ncbi:MAG: ParA family protein [Rhodanobacteraceae bacterium]|nr:ParA family protein [Rhodanobacteraceae bacterium]
MTVPVLTFFNNKGGVGKTSLVYHLAWMFSVLGHRVVAADLDPQANLTSAFLPEEELEVLWDQPSSAGNRTIYQCVQPLTDVGDINDPEVRQITPNLFLIPGDLGLAGFEDSLSQEWPSAIAATSPRPFRLLTAFWQVLQRAARAQSANVILADVGPNLGAINRSALIGSDHVAIPLAADLFSLQGLRNLGPTLARWRKDWQDRLARAPPQLPFSLPAGTMRPAGYIVMQHGERLSRPVQAYKKWTDRIPGVYYSDILGAPGSEQPIDSDPACLAKLKHYRSLVPMALEARKPIFHLTAADGAIGSHLYAARDAGQDFTKLALKLLSVMGLPSAPEQRPDR